MPPELTRRAFLGTVATATVGAVASTGVADTPRGPGIIDCHVHLKHGDAAATEWSADEIVALMDESGIDRSIVFAIKTTTAHSIEMASEAAEKYPDRLIPFAYGLPSYEGPVLRQIETAVTEQGFRGIKVHAGECPLSEYIIDPLLRFAGSFPIACLIDVTGNSVVAARMAEAFPKTPFWFAHMGRYNSTDADMLDRFIQLAADHENVWLDLSAVGLPGKIGEAVSKVGADKLVWGTDGPYRNPTVVEYARSEMNKVQQQDITEQEKQKILGGNVARLLKLGDATS